MRWDTAWEVRGGAGSSAGGADPAVSTRSRGGPIQGSRGGGEHEVGAAGRISCKSSGRRLGEVGAGREEDDGGGLARRRPDPGGSGRSALVEKRTMEKLIVKPEPTGICDGISDIRWRCAGRVMVKSQEKLIVKPGPEYAAKHKTLIYLAGLATAEVVADVALCPMEAIKVRVQTQLGYAKGLSDGFPKIVRNEGYAGLFRGLVPLWGRQIPSWEPFRDFIPEDERNCFITAYSKRLTSSDTDVQAEAAKRWTMWEMMTAHLIQNHENIKQGDDDKFSLAFARIEIHYFVNKGFLSSDSYLLDNVDKIRHIKAFIVQGQYDVCCPMMSAWDLHKAWPEAEFKVDKING